MTDPQSTLTHNLPQEEWRPVVGYAGWYEVSSLGRVRRVAPLPAHRQYRVFAPRDNGNGYLQVQFCTFNKRQSFYVHVLVAAAFIGACPLGYEVNHKDLHRDNCRADNLEYLTRLDNNHHSLPFRASPSVFTAEALRNIRNSDSPIKEIARSYGVDPRTIRNIKNGTTWRHVA